MGEMQDRDKLICPKCGSKAELYCMDGGDYWWDTYSVECENCGYGTSQYDTVEDALKEFFRNNSTK